MTLLLRNVVAWDCEMEKARLCDIQIEGTEILSKDDAGTGTGEEIFDGKGMTAVLPGLVNAHTHAAMTLMRGLGEELPLMEWLTKRIWPIEERLTPYHVRVGTQLALLEMLSCGITCFGDMYFFEEEVAEASLEAGMRCGLSRGLIGEDEAKLAEGVSLFDRYNAVSDLVTIQLGPHAPYTVPPKMLSRIADVAKEKGIGVHLHWLETRWEQEYFSKELRISPQELLEKTGLWEVPFLSLAHGVWISTDFIEGAARENVTILHNPNSNLKLGSGIAPLPEMLSKGVHVALGTDGAASNNRLDLWDEIRTASLVHKGTKKDPSIVTARQVLRMATLEGARALGFADVGLLRPGWQADLQLIDLDRPHFVGWDLETLPECLVYAGSARDVVGTMVAGRWLYREKEFFTLDRTKVMAEAQRCRQELASRN